MLESIRAGAQSIGIKIAFGVIILVFVFWGVGNFNDRDYTNVVAVVNGQPILAIEFEKAYQNAEEFILRNNPGMTRQQLEKQHLGRQVLRDLVQETLLEQEAARTGVEITPLEMRRYVDGIKVFHNEQGKFDPEAYKRVLASQRMSPAQYENELAKQLMHEKMYNLVTSSVWINPDETSNRFNFLREKREIDYIFIPSKKFDKNIKISDEEIKKWYDDNKNDFLTPARVDIAYIDVQPDKLVDKNKIGEDAIKTWYDANTNKFETKEQVKVAHILVPLNEDADEKQVGEATAIIEKIRQELAAGKPFKELANEHNQPGAASAGGELGWIARGETVPAFEEAAFATETGKVSEPVRTPFGLHLVLVEEKRAAGIRPLQDVIDEVKQAIAFEEGSDQVHEVVDNLIEDNILMKPLDEASAKYGLKAQKSGLLSRQELTDKLGLSVQDAEALISTPVNSPIDSALIAGDKYLVARVIAAEPAGVKPMDEVKEQISKELKNQESIKAAMGEALKLLTKIRNLPANNPEVIKENPKTDIIVERGELVADFAPDVTLNKDIFSVPDKSWLPEPHAVTTADGSGAILVYVDKIISPDNAELKNIDQILTESIQKDRKDAIYAIFMQKLIDDAKIDIKNQNIIDRTNG